MLWQLTGNKKKYHLSKIIEHLICMYTGWKATVMNLWMLPCVNQKSRRLYNTEKETAGVGGEKDCCLLT
jgi:hypothetical protein